MNVSSDWKNLGKRAALQSISVIAELFSEAAIELNKLAESIDSSHDASEAKPFKEARTPESTDTV